jgi:mono/diheme cytochrome c family protein
VKRQPDRAAGKLGGLPAAVPAVILCCAAAFAGAALAQDPAPEPIRPYLSDPAALAEAEKIYRSRCIGCHFRSGGRGPNLFRTRLTLTQFVEIVAKGGRPGMPAWGATLSGEDILKLYALLMSRDSL